MTEADIQSLIAKFRKILVARMRGHRADARVLFDDITVNDFPIMPEFRMSHGLNGDAEGALTNLSGVHFSGVLRGETYPLGQLDRIDLRSLNERIQQHHEHSNLPLVFCGIKNVLDTDPASKTWLSWLPTVEGLVMGSSKKEVRDALENVYSFDFRDGLLKWPLSSLPCAVGHAIDSGFPWRRGGRVEAGHVREFALCLSRYDMSVLYTLNGCRRETKRIVVNPSVRERLEKIASAQANAGK